MRCYYRNGISCGANIREFEDQSVIKGKIKIKWDKTKLVSHLGDWEGFYVKRREEKRREKKKKRKKRRRRGFQVWITMGLYGLLWICEHLYGLLWFCMDL